MGESRLREARGEISFCMRCHLTHEHYYAAPTRMTSVSATPLISSLFIFRQSLTVSSLYSGIQSCDFASSATALGAIEETGLYLLATAGRDSRAKLWAVRIYEVKSVRPLEGFYYSSLAFNSTIT